MNENKEKPINISTQADLDNLIDRIEKGSLIAKEFKFVKRRYLIDLLKSLGVGYEEFTKTYYYFDNIKHLHISESEFGYVWISTHGLIAKDKSTDNKAVNACVTQYTVISLLMDKAIETSLSKKVYDVDSHDFGYLSELSPALFHNLLFYIEVFCKAYLSLSGIGSPNTHKLSIVYSRLIDTMFTKKHNDTLFQVLIADKFAKIVEHVTKIPGNFKEQFVKYDDNPEDTTVTIFQPESLKEINMMLELCHDFILDYYYIGDKTHYLHSGLFQRVLDKAETDEQKKRIIDMYSHITSKDNENK
jgi:hypothetical protein